MQIISQGNLSNPKEEYIEKRAAGDDFIHPWEVVLTSFFMRSL